jgi:hypothetical protein
MGGPWTAGGGLLAGIGLGLLGSGLAEITWPPMLPLGAALSLLGLAIAVVLAANTDRLGMWGLTPIMGWAVGACWAWNTAVAGVGVRGWALAIAAACAAGLLFADGRAFSQQP